jgi:NADH dehydrogenase
VVEFSAAVRNSNTLVEACVAAGVRRFVHISISNPTATSSLPYFKGKALVEEALIQSGLSYGIVRPTVIFGRGDVFINNIAWLLRRFPVFAIPGDGLYQIQPVHVDDVARLCVEFGATSDEVVRDAAGPEIFTFEEMVRTIAVAIGHPRPLINCPPTIALSMARLIGVLVRDVVVNLEELQGLMANLVVSSEEPTGQIRFTDWLKENSGTLGRRYASEIGRNFKRPFQAR